MHAQVLLGRSYLDGSIHPESELWTRRGIGTGVVLRVNVKHLRVFSSIAYVHVLDEKLKKLDAKVEKYILAGYSHEQKEHKCYQPSDQICTSELRCLVQLVGILVFSSVSNSRRLHTNC